MADTPATKLAPSILSADFGRLAEQVEEAEEAGADYLHVDVMDGHFVPNLTVGPLVVEALKGRTRMTLDVHMMVTDPERWIQPFAEAGADILTLHAEATPHLHRAVQAIKERDIRAGISLNPSTSPIALEQLLPSLDLVLVMSVNPGYGGQSFIEASVDKLRRVRSMLDEGGLGAELEVDGGINERTAPKVVKAGARVLVAGSAIFNGKESVADAISRLRASIGNGPSRS